jgi:hypothetical protein
MLKFLLLSLSLLLPCPAHAYNEAGHYDTVSLSLNVCDGPDLGGIVSFCSQLPDKTYELDAKEQTTAKTVFLSLFRVARPDDAEVQHVFTIQELLHGLTGGASQPLLEASSAILSDLRDRAIASRDPATLCALGLSLHLFGDAFAHRKMNNPQTMYSCGIGHASVGMAADAIFERLPIWTEYVNALNAFWRPGCSNLHALTLEFEMHGCSWSCNAFNNWQEQEARERLRALNMFSTAYQPERSERLACQQHVDRYMPGYGLSCSKAWQTFRSTAIRHFQEKVKQDRSLFSKTCTISKFAAEDLK